MLRKVQSYTEGLGNSGGLIWGKEGRSKEDFEDPRAFIFGS
jgi:hypothetical protein